jgi:hypothetical protein
MPRPPFAVAAMRRILPGRTSSSSSSSSAADLQSHQTHDSAASAAGNGRASSRRLGGAGSGGGRGRRRLLGGGAGDIWRMVAGAAVGSLAAWLVRRGRPRRPHPRLLAMPGSCTTDKDAPNEEPADQE